MRLFDVNLNDRVAVVAEIGVNHEGDLAAARRLVGLAKDSGADAVKLQSYSPDRYASSSDRARLERVSKFALSREHHVTVLREAEKVGIAAFSTPLSEDWVPFLAEHCPAIKIASGDIDFEPVIRAAARTGKPVILSTGLGSLEEVDRAVSWVREEVGADRLRERLVLMQCVSAYPAPIEEASVLAIEVLAERFGVHVGYSNHVIGPEACWAAVARGAAMLEVHFTDRKTGREFRDHALSFEPDDLKALVDAVPRIKASLGPREKRPQPSEIGNLRAVRKGVVAARDLPAGAVLARDDLMFARPATEFPASAIGALVGRRLNSGLKRGELVTRAGID